MARARKKVILSYIINESKRRRTFEKRKNGLIKKIDEISTLCGIKACAIIFSQNNPQPQVWPSPWEVQSVLWRFKSLSEMDQRKNMLNQESFLKQRIEKGQEKLKKQMNENRMKEMTCLMFQCISGAQTIENIGIDHINDLSWVIDQKLKQIVRRIDETQPEVVVENHAENAVAENQVENVVVENHAENAVAENQAENHAENAVAENQAENIMVENHAENAVAENVVVENHAGNVIGMERGMGNNVDAMQNQDWSLDFTNNNFGDVLPFENGNNVPNDLWSY